MLATLVRERSGVATESVGGVIFSAADRSDLSSLKDLAGQTIATPGFHFLGGFQAPALELRDAGVDLFRQTHLKLVGSHDRVLKAVLSGDADAGFIRTGILEQLAEDNGDLLARIRVLNRQNLPGFPYIASTRLYPEWPLAALPHVRSEVVRRVASALFALEPDHPAARAARIAGFAPPADYQSVEHLARSLRIAPYDEVPLVSWVDVFQQYRPWLLTVATLVLMLVVATLWLGKKRRELSLAQRRLRRLVQSWPQPCWCCGMTGSWIATVPRSSCCGQRGRVPCWGSGWRRFCPGTASRRRAGIPGRCWLGWSPGRWRGASGCSGAWTVLISGWR